MEVLTPTTVATQEVADTEAFITARALLDERQEPGTLIPGDFAQLHTRVADLHKSLDVHDIDRPLNESAVRYVNGKAAISFRAGDGHWTTPMSFTRNGIGQLGYRVLGGGGLKYLDRLRSRGLTGQQIAEINWQHDLQYQTRPSLLRTVQLPGQDFRTVRSVLSGGGNGYQVFDGVHLLEVLAGVPEFANLPVIDSTVTIDHTRVRFLLNPEDAALFDPATGKLRNPTNSHDTGLNLMVPMGEVGTGSIGQSATWVNGGGYQFRCLNGLGSWESNSGWRWTHGGHNPEDRVRDGLRGAIESLRVTASGVVQDYNSAFEVQVADAWSLLDAWGVGAGRMTQKQARRAHEALDDETCTRGRNLARIVDGITLAAQTEEDLVQQRAMEQFAHRLMQRGLRNAHQNNGSVVITEVAEA